MFLRALLLLVRKLPQPSQHEATPGYDTVTGSGGVGEGNTSENMPGANNP